jgi:hypothetical protein
VQSKETSRPSDGCEFVCYLLLDDIKHHLAAGDDRSAMLVLKSLRLSSIRDGKSLGAWGKK